MTTLPSGARSTLHRCCYLGANAEIVKGDHALRVGLLYRDASTIRSVASLSPDGGFWPSWKEFAKRCPSTLTPSLATSAIFVTALWQPRTEFSKHGDGAWRKQRAWRYRTMALRVRSACMPARSCTEKAHSEGAFSGAARGSGPRLSCSGRKRCCCLTITH